MIFLGRPHKLFLFAFVMCLLCANADSWQGPPIQDEMHFGIDGGYIYIVPYHGSFAKIEKEKGEVVWKNQLAHVGACSAPVFRKGRYLAVSLEYFGGNLFSINCDTGAPALAFACEFGCQSSPACVFAPILWKDSLIAFSGTDIKAIRLSDSRLMWELSCKRGDFKNVFDYYMAGDRLYAFVWRVDDAQPADSKLPSYLLPKKFEMIEIDCATGAVTRRFDKNAFPSGQEIMGAYSLGDWHGKKLILASYAGASRDRLFAFDPRKRRFQTLIDELEYPPYAEKHREIWYWRHKPVILKDSLFFLFAPGTPKEGAFPPAGIMPERTLIAKSLTTGTTVWEAEDEEIPCAAAGEVLFTHFTKESVHYVNCRSAATGAVIWSTMLKNRDAPARVVHQVQPEGDRLYVLTGSYLHALNILDGKELWKAPVGPEARFPLNLFEKVRDALPLD